jgi:hypothetical protein
MAASPTSESLEATLRTQVREYHIGLAHNTSFYKPEIEIQDCTSLDGYSGRMFELKYWEDEDCGTMLHKMMATWFHEETNPLAGKAVNRIVFVLRVGHAQVIVCNAPDAVAVSASEDDSSDAESAEADSSVIATSHSVPSRDNAVRYDWDAYRVCRICGGDCVRTCKCNRGDSFCAQGHHWHRCVEHGVIVSGGADHAHGAPDCNCAGRQTWPMPLMGDPPVAATRRSARARKPRDRFAPY